VKIGSNHKLIFVGLNFSIENSYYSINLLKNQLGRCATTKEECLIRKIPLFSKERRRRKSMSFVLAFFRIWWIH